MVWHSARAGFDGAGGPAGLIVPMHSPSDLAIPTGTTRPSVVASIYRQGRCESVFAHKLPTYSKEALPEPGTTWVLVRKLNGQRNSKRLVPELELASERTLAAKMRSNGESRV